MRLLLTIICTISISLFSSLRAQDVIVTTDHDTLNAKVLKITEKITSYKLESYLDGPTYELSNGRIDKIIYGNGEEFSFDNGSPQGAPLYNQHKNSIEFVASELVFLRGSLAYSRFISDNFEIRAGASISMIDVTQTYGNNFENYGELQFNYHPLSFRKLDYYIGLRGRMGNSRGYYYVPYYYYDTYYYEYTISNNVVGTLGVVNGLRLNINQRFAINASFSLEAYMREARGAIKPILSGSFGACYKF